MNLPLPPVNMYPHQMNMMAPSWAYGETDLILRDYSPCAGPCCFSFRQYDELKKDNYTFDSQREKSRPIKVKRPSKQRRPRVRFASTTPIAHSAPIKSREELRETWYRSQDYSSFSRELKETINAVNQAHGDLRSLDPNKYCLRGIERQLSRQQVYWRKMLTRRLKQVVLEQQYYQRYCGYYDPTSLQAVSQYFSVPEAKRAHLRALTDYSTQPF